MAGLGGVVASRVRWVGPMLPHDDHGLAWLHVEHRSDRAAPLHLDEWSTVPQRLYKAALCPTSTPAAPGPRPKYELRRVV